MKIGIISDSHDNVENIKKAVQIFKDQKVDFLNFQDRYHILFFLLLSAQQKACFLALVEMSYF